MTLGANVGLGMAAGKQYGVVRQAQGPKPRVEQDATTDTRVKGGLSDSQVADLTTSANVDEYVPAMTGQDKVEQTRTWKQPTLASLEQGIRDDLSNQLANAHNKISEGFYGFKVSVKSSIYRALGGDPARLNEIRREVISNEQKNLGVAWARVAGAETEQQIYT